MIKPTIPLQYWLNLSWQVRAELTNALNVKKSQDSCVMDGIVLSDGRIQADIDQAFTVESMQEYTKSKAEDVFDLFSKTAEKAEYDIFVRDNPNIKQEVKAPQNEDEGLIPSNFMQLKKYAKEKGVNTSIYKTKQAIISELQKL